MTRFAVFPNTGTHFGPESAGIRPFPAISPNGKLIVFQAQEPDGPVSLWVRALDSIEAQRLPGTEKAGIPFWSPDSRYIAFTADDKLKKIEVIGGTVQVLCDLWRTSDVAAEGTWGTDGTILFAHGGGNGATPNEGILRIPESGGKPTVLLAPNKERKETVLRAPYFLPDGKHFLFLAQDPNVTWVGSTDASEPPKRLLPTDSRAEFAPEGYLLFVQQGNLMAQRFDTKTLGLSGAALPVAQSVRVNTSNGRAAFSTADNGTLVYRTGPVGGETLQVVIYDREGTPKVISKQTGDNRNPRLSPDEKQLAVERRAAAAGCANCTDLWTIDLARGTSTRITFGKGDVRFGGWSADGTRLYYASNPEAGPYAIFSKLASGVGNEELVLKFDRAINSVTDVSANYLFFTITETQTGTDIWYLPLTGTDRTPKPFIATPFNQGTPRLSPDGHWIAYQSNESGQNQIYVQPFPATGQRIPISVGGGVQPRWRADGKELFFISPARVLMSADIKLTASSVEAGTPKRVFVLPDRAGNSIHVTRDGQRFFISAPSDALTANAAAADTTPLTVVTNWTAALKLTEIK